MRRVPDPDRIAVDRKTGKLITSDIPYILNPVDLSAVELALRAKEQTGAAVTVVSIDEPAAEHEVREALAMGCDRALLLSDEAFESTDTLAQAQLFRVALERFVRPQLVFAACRSIDHNWSSVGPQLAQALNWPLVIEAETVEMAPSKWRGIAHTGAYRARIESELPAIVTVARGVIRPRTPTSWGIAAAYDERKVDVKNLHDLGVDPTTLSQFAPKTRVLRVEERKRKREHRLIEGEAPEVGRILARRLIDQGWAGRRP